MRVNLVIITLRDVFQWAVRHSPEEYQKRSALIRLSPADLRDLGMKDGDLLRLKNAQGEVVVRARADPHCPKGCGLMPLSPYANLLSDYTPGRGGLPNFKGIPVSAEPAQGEVTPLPSLERRQVAQTG